MTDANSNSAGNPPRDPQQPGSSDRFFSWLRGLGITRSDERWFAGVAGGIAAKAGIDPLIVRGVFVVLAVLGGPGLLLYLVSWALLPDQSGSIHLENVFRGRASGGVMAAVIVLGTLVLIPLVIGVFRGLFGFSLAWWLPDWATLTLGIIWWAVILPAVIIWLIVWLSGNRGRGSGPGGPRTTGAPNASFSERAEAFSTAAGEWGEQFGQKADKWGHEVGAKADEWGQKVDEKARTWEQNHRDYLATRAPSAGFIAISLALALLLGGIAASAVLGLGVSTDMVLTAGLVTAVAVLALAMIISGIRGRDSGWVGFFAFVGALALLFAPFSTVLPSQTQVVPFGNVTELPRSNEDSAILMVAGNPTVDLRGLRAGDTPGELEVWLLGGTVEVELPDDFPVKVQVNMLGGNVQDSSGNNLARHSGAFLNREINAHIDEAESEHVMTVRVRVLGGNVRIEGSNS